MNLLRHIPARVSCGWNERRGAGGRRRRRQNGFACPAALPVLLALWSAAWASGAPQQLPRQASGTPTVQNPAAPAAASAPPASPAAQAIAAAEEELRSHPNDADALEALARAEAASGDLPAAIAAYRKVVAAHPGDRGAQIQLGRLLGWNRQYGEAIRIFNAVLAELPDDREALDELAGVQRRSGDLSAAAASYARLAAQYPTGTEYLFEAARLEQQLNQYAAARDRLALLLALEPENTDARLLLAQLELREGQYASSLRQFERVLGSRPGDLAARLGAAQARYYTGDLGKAYAEASQVVASEPGNFDALFLLASIERARGRHHEARALLRRADRLARRNPEVIGLREKLWQESSTVLHLTAGYARETGTAAGAWVPLRFAGEDLRTFTLGSRLDFLWLPRSTSSLSFSAFPVENRTGPSSNATPAGFMYSQTTRVTSRLTLRGGLGMESFGPVKPVTWRLGAVQIGDGPQLTAGRTPVGYAGASFSPSSHLSIDFTWSRAAMAYTPAAAWLGAISNRKELGLNFGLDPRTTLALTYFRDSISTQEYVHAAGVTEQGFTPPFHTASDREQGSGGTLVLNRRVVSRERLALEAGMSALVLGYDGPRRNLYFGFFTPSFYQRELATAKLSGRISSRLTYSFAAGLGVQQVNQGTSFEHAVTLNPSLRLKLTPYLSAELGYSYYNSAQSIGIVRGNGVRLGIDWRF